MKRRMLHMLAVCVIALGWIAAPHADGPGDCKAICEWQEFECSGSWNLDCDDLDSYYDFGSDTCDLDSACVYG